MLEELETLRRVSPQVAAAAVLGLDGALESVSSDAELEDVIGPTLTTFGEIANRVSTELGRGALNGAILDGEYGHVITRDLTDGRLLVVVAQGDIRLGLLLDDVRVCADRLARGVAHA